MDDTLNELLEFFKALADANRLKIIGLLAQSDYTVEQLAAMLDVKAPTVSHHMAKLAAAGLVTARAESYYSIYHLETGVLEKMARQLLVRETIPAVTAGVDMDAYDRKVISTFCDSEGRIEQFPAQRKKVEVLLRHVAKRFKPGIRYSTKEMNEILGFFSDDIATLRRGLIIHHIMDREDGGGAYWLRE